MKKFRIDLDVTKAEGSQTIEVEATTPEQALEKFRRGESDIVDSEVEVIGLSAWEPSDIYEFQD